MASPDPDISFNLRSNNDTSDNINTENQHHENDENDTQNHRPSVDRHMPDDDRFVNVTGDAEHYFSSNNNSSHTHCETQLSRPRFEHRGNFAPPAIPVVHPSLIRPDNYEGSGDFEAYMSHFEDCAELSGWDDKSKCLVLASCLRGSARSFYMSLPQSEKRDYFLLCRRLASRFSNSKHQNLWLLKFESRRRQRGESIAALADDLRQLAQRAYQDLDIHSQERLALNQLYKQVSPDMQCRCIDNGCRTITDAVNVIERYEAVLGTHSTFVRALSEESSTNSDTDMRKCLQRIESRLDRLEKVCPRGPPFQNSRHKKPQSPGCFGCKANDHYWRDCPNNTERNRFTNTNNMLHHNQQPPNRMFEQKHNVLDGSSSRRQMNDNRSEN